MSNVVGFETVWEREGVSHTEYAMKEAVHQFAYAQDFEVGSPQWEEWWKNAVASLNHAWYLAATQEEKPSPDRAKQLYHELEMAAKVWER